MRGGTDESKVKTSLILKGFALQFCRLIFSFVCRIRRILESLFLLTSMVIKYSLCFRHYLLLTLALFQSWRCASSSRVQSALYHPSLCLSVALHFSSCVWHSTRWFLDVLLANCVSSGVGCLKPFSLGLFYKRECIWVCVHANVP